eukprot:g2552.t1
MGQANYANAYAGAPMGQAIRSNAPVAQPIGQAELVEAGQYDAGAPLLATAGAGVVPTAVAVEPLKPDVRDEEQNAPKYRDTWAAFLFIVMVGVIAYYTHDFAAHGGIAGHSTPAPAPAPGTYFSKHELHAVLEVVAVAVVFAAAVSLLWLWTMISFAGKIIEFTLVSSIALYVALGLVSFAHNVHAAAWVFFLLAAITGMYYFCVRNRIPFAAANLTTACAAIKAHLCTLCVSFFVLVLNFAWMMMWMCAVLGLVENAPKTCVSTVDDDDAGSFNPHPGPTSQCSLGPNPDGTCPTGCSESHTVPYGAAFGLLVAFYWGLQVFKNLSHTTTAGSVGSWWFTPDETNAVGGALRRSCTWSFGSICFGSLVVAILRALEQMARAARGRDGNGAGACLECVAQCILGCLESLMEWINKWAFVYVGLYGFSFAASGRAVFKLFNDRGWTAIINDDLVENALSFAALVTGALTGAVSYGLVHGPWGDRFDSADPSDPSDPSRQDVASYIAAGVGVLLGFAVAAVVMSVIEAAVCTVFVCFAEDPEALRRSRPDHHLKLVNAWSRFHPQILLQCGFVDRQY